MRGNACIHHTSYIHTRVHLKKISPRKDVKILKKIQLFWWFCTTQSTSGLQYIIFFFFQFFLHYSEIALPRIGEKICLSTNKSSWAEQHTISSLSNLQSSHLASTHHSLSMLTLHAAMCVLFHRHYLSSPMHIYAYHLPTYLPQDYIACCCVMARAFSLYCDRSFTYILAISGTKGSSGFGSVRSEQIDSKTFEMVSAGLHWSFKISRQIPPFALMLGW